MSDDSNIGNILRQQQEHITRLEAELKVRVFVPLFPTVPAKWRGHRSAWLAGFENGWRDAPFVNVYTSRAHREAFTKGYAEGRDQAAEQIRLAIATRPS